MLCPRHTLSLAKRLGLKTKSVKVDLVKAQIGEIWANRMIIELDVLFTNNPDW